MIILSSISVVFFRVLGVCGRGQGDCFGVETEMQITGLAEFPGHLKPENVNKTIPPPKKNPAYDVFNALVTGRIIYYQTPALKQTYMSNLNAKRIKATAPSIPIQNLKPGHCGSRATAIASHVLQALGLDTHMPLSLQTFNTFKNRNLALYFFLTPHKPTRGTQQKTNKYFSGRINTKADMTFSLNSFVVITGYTESQTYTSTHFREKNLRKETQVVNRQVKTFFSTGI